MARLTGELELLDGPLDDPRTLGGNLRDLRRVNRYLGGTALSRRAIGALASPVDALSVLDVGTGDADIPLDLLADAARSGRRLTVTAVDHRPEVLDAARRAHPGLDSVANLTLELADGLALPYPDAAFDVTHASLLLHHFEPAESVTLLRELARVARRGIVVNDLSRGPITVAGAWLLSRVSTRNRFTRHDAPMSARRAYTLPEARVLLEEAGLHPVLVTRGLLGHRWAIAAVRR